MMIMDDEFLMMNEKRSRLRPREPRNCGVSPNAQPNSPGFQNPKFKIQNSTGFALVVILAFVVLLTVLVLAYFSYSALQRQISSASSNQATVDIFSQGAINTIVSDFKQEIFAGSTNFTVGTNTISIPLTQSNAIPARVGTSSNLPNLIKRSAGGLAFYPGGPVRASAASTTNASQNGRSMSPSRWNAAMLLPKAATNSTDLTPANFTAPDWILVNRGGGNPTAWSSDMAWSGGATNTNTVIGRYAYAIYDEGGLLDVNVAGCPPGTADTVTSYKSAIAFADLTQVGLQTSSIAALVGWRNTATAQPGGSFPNYTFSATSQTNFSKAIATNSTGFLSPANASLVGGESDRQFISRQQLIQFFNTLADSSIQPKADLQNALQYLATFTRALDQPSFAPDPLRPKIIGSAAPPVALSADNYQGNNDAWGGDDLVNPSFLSIRVASAFTRRDGSPAVVGEPLVKKRFPLDRLAFLTYEGPSSSAPAATRTALLNAGVSQAILDEGTPANILGRFGLTWDSTNKVWIYNHGSAAILTLSQVAAANREPDFAELLKASIGAGSLGKGGPNGNRFSSANVSNYQFTLDSSLDYHVLQLMANLIDQADPDSYPTSIQIAAGSVNRVFRGVEDLPYFYRYHPFAVVTRLPVPLLSKDESVVFPMGTTGYSGSSDYAFKGARKTLDPDDSLIGPTLTDTGEATLLYIPEVWNPHDRTAVNASGRPTQFRIVAMTQDPAQQTPAWSIGARSTMQNAYSTGQGILNLADYPKSVAAPLTEAGSVMLFTDNGGQLLREPTLLWREGYPAGVSLSGGSVITDINTTQRYLGVIIGTTKISMERSIDGKRYVFQGNRLPPFSDLPVGSYEQICFRLQFLDASGKWITYDEKYPDLHGLASPILAVNQADWSNNGWKNPFRTGAFSTTASSYDPRTARFGIGTESTWGNGSASDNPTLEISAGNFGANSVAGNDAVANSNFTLLETQRPRIDAGNYVRYSTPCMTSDPGKNQQMRWFSGVGFSASNAYPTSCPFFFNGLLSQNNPAANISTRQGGNTAQIYYEDPDGIARRAMAAYVPVGALNVPATSTTGLPEVTAYTGFASGNGTATSQVQSRPMILNRPFKSVGEMSYAARGLPWKQIDFFTPESGDSALLDTFCINTPPSDALVAGKLNLNTRQAPVLKAVLSGAYREELANRSGGLPSGTLASPLSATEIDSIANKLVSITTDTTNAWRGPISNISQIVGRFVPNPGTIGSATDVYQFTEPVTNVSYTYAGFSAALDSSVYVSATAASIQRLREAAIRPLASVGQVRVWNVLLDVVAQVGRYGSGATSADQFIVEGEGRYWVHLAIDRFTGKVLDRQVELVTE